MSGLQFASYTTRAHLTLMRVDYNTSEIIRCRRKFTSSMFERRSFGSSTVRACPIMALVKQSLSKFIFGEG